MIDGYLRHEFGGQALDAITADDIERYRDRLLLETVYRPGRSCAT